MCPSTGNSHLVAVSAAAADFRPAFDVLDADRDGKISQDDLRSFYSALPSRPSEEDICSMMTAADADHDGFVEFGEFERVIGQRIDGGGIMMEVFRAMDRDGDGRVGFEDLGAYLEFAGIPAGDEEIRAMIRLGGGGDAVSFHALVKILGLDLADD